MKKFKNNKQIADVWLGQEIQPNNYYEISTLELINWQNNSKVLADLGSGDGIINNGTSDILDVAKAINYLLDNSTKTVFSEQYPFAQKITKDGKKLFRRKHGVKKTIAANSTDTIDFIVPYALVKINKAEIINCIAGDTVSLKIYDNAVGTISTVPNYLLNQFGFDVVMPDGMYADESNYEAELIQGMKIQLVYTNNSTTSREVGLNITLHQVV